MQGPVGRVRGTGALRSLARRRENSPAVFSRLSRARNRSKPIGNRGDVSEESGDFEDGEKNDIGREGDVVARRLQ